MLARGKKAWLRSSRSRFMVICWFFVAGIFSSRGSLIQTDSLDLCKFVRGSNSVHSSDFQNMDQTSSAQSRGSAPSNFYSMSRTPSPYSGSSSRVSSVGLSSSSVQSSGSTPLSSRDTTQQLITGLAACQSSVEELLQTVRSSNEWIEELTEKVKILDGRVEKLSSNPVDGTESVSDGRGEKRKRTKLSLLVQVSLKILTEKPWIAVVYLIPSAKLTSF